MLFFDGLSKTCVKFKRTKVGFRCAKFGKAAKVGRHPKCPPGDLKGGGRSQWAIRAGKRCSKSSKRR